MLDKSVQDRLDMLDKWARRLNRQQTWCRVIAFAFFLGSFWYLRQDLDHYFPILHLLPITLLWMVNAHALGEKNGVKILYDKVSKGELDPSFEYELFQPVEFEEDCKWIHLLLTKGSLTIYPLLIICLIGAGLG